MAEKSSNYHMLEANGRGESQKCWEDYDLLAGNAPSLQYRLFSGIGKRLLSCPPEKAVTKGSIRLRKIIHPLFLKFWNGFLHHPQVIENSNCLKDPSGELREDKGTTLGKEPVIWACSHNFHDDGLGTLLAIRRHGYFMFGSLPIYFNTLDGIAAWLNGAILVNRRNSASKKASIPKDVRLLKMGTDLIFYPEGVWNNSPNDLILNLWPGIWRIAHETGAKVVPVVNFVDDDADPKSPIHTVVDDPIDMGSMVEKEGLAYLRDVMATWLYLMIEAYAKISRAALIGEEDPNAVWERVLRNKTRPVLPWYDWDIEIKSTYSPKENPAPDKVWEPISNIENINAGNIRDILYARHRVTVYRNEDWQHKKVDD